MKTKKNVPNGCRGEPKTWQRSNSIFEEKRREGDKERERDMAMGRQGDGAMGRWAKRL